MRCLSGISQPQARVAGKLTSDADHQMLIFDIAMCDYLKIQEPEYWTERHSFGELWFARFLTEQPTSKTGHTLIAPTVVQSLNGLQECARMVEYSLFEKIYSHEIHLEDGCAVFPDRASQNQQIHQSHLNPRQKRLLQRDEGSPLAKIAERYDAPAKLDHLSTTTKAVPLEVAERPIIQASRKDQETRHESGANLYTHAMMRAHGDPRAPARNQLNLSDIPQPQKARQPVTSPTLVARGGVSTGSKNLRRANNTAQQPQAINKVNKAEQLIKPKDANAIANPHLLPSGTHRYVSPPPFRETTRPHLATNMAPPPPKPKTQTHRDDPDDDEVIYVGQRSIRDDVGFVSEGVKRGAKRGVKRGVKQDVQLKLEEGEIL